MYGRNPSRPVEHAQGEVLSVQEIFSTIQGEGPHAGTPAIFIRLWGCHLKCHFCDTDFESVNDRMHIHEIATEVLKYQIPNPLIVLTGGEPMRQNIAPLIYLLLRDCSDVQVETSGTLWVDAIDRYKQEAPAAVDWDMLSFIVSPKTQFVHEKIIENAFAWKYIVNAGGLDEEDGLPIMSTQISGARARIKRPPDYVPAHHIFLQPRDDGSPIPNKDNLKEAIAACMKHGYRLSLQQHKIIGLP